MHPACRSPESLDNRLATAMCWEWWLFHPSRENWCGLGCLRSVLTFKHCWALDLSYDQPWIQYWHSLWIPFSTVPKIWCVPLLCSLAVYFFHDWLYCSYSHWISLVILLLRCLWHFPWAVKTVSLLSLFWFIVRNSLFERSSVFKSFFWENTTKNYFKFHW